MKRLESNQETALKGRYFLLYKELLLEPNIPLKMSDLCPPAPSTVNCKSQKIVIPDLWSKFCNLMYWDRGINNIIIFGRCLILSMDHVALSHSTFGLPTKNPAIRFPFLVNTSSSYSPAAPPPLTSTAATSQRCPCWPRALTATHLESSISPVFCPTIWGYYE